MSWGQFVVRGMPYDLRHLDPFVMTVRPQAQGAPIMRVLVTFGCHCFTRDVEPHDHVDFEFPDGKRAVRTFCPVRHGWSQDLPRLVRDARNNYAYSSRQQNFLLVKPRAGGVPYTVFFNMVRTNSKKLSAVMSVVSAYEKPKLPTELPAMPFVALVGNTAMKRPIKPGPLRKW